MHTSTQRGAYSPQSAADASGTNHDSEQSRAITLASRQRPEHTRWRRQTSTTHAAPTHAALQRAASLMIQCTACDSLVSLRAARRAAKRHAHAHIWPGDGCPSCTKTHKPARWARTQIKYARELLSNHRTLVYCPPTTANRTTLHTVPLNEAHRHAHWCITCIADAWPALVGAEPEGTHLGH